MRHFSSRILAATALAVWMFGVQPAEAKRGGKGDRKQPAPSLWDMGWDDDGRGRQDKDDKRRKPKPKPGPRDDGDDD